MPLTVSVPEVGVSRAATQRRKVVLPQPEGPMKLTNSPFATESETSLSACTGPSAVWKTRLTPLASMTGAAVCERVAAFAIRTFPSGDISMTSCQKISPGATTYAGKQWFHYFEGIARE